MSLMRQKEIGIRIALGAERATVLSIVLRQAIVPVVLGCALGAAGAVATEALWRCCVRSRPTCMAEVFESASWCGVCRHYGGVEATVGGESWPLLPSATHS